MKFISLFSGIEAASVAWKPLGWTPIAFSEIEPFPCSVLAHHYPDVPNHGDITRFNWSAYRGKATDPQLSADVLRGITQPPCPGNQAGRLKKGI
jgi:site-specific DNA-cytosine methylase